MPVPHHSVFTGQMLFLPAKQQRQSTKGTHHHHNHFTTLFLGPSGSAGARRELLDFMVQGKIKRGRHTNHPAGHHSIRTNQCLPPPYPHLLQARCPSCHPTNSVKALQATRAFGLGRRRWSSHQRYYLHHSSVLKAQTTQYNHYNLHNYFSDRC